MWVCNGEGLGSLVIHVSQFCTLRGRLTLEHGGRALGQDIVTSPPNESARESRGQPNFPEVPSSTYPDSSQLGTRARVGSRVSFAPVESGDTM